MCGICGYIGLEDRDLVKKMAHLLAHRGPDEEGFFYFDKGALGHKRLSIIDLVTGSQPMTDDTGSCQVAYNGEIYNFKELRADLQSKGFKFKTDSDTEVILNIYKLYGIEGFKKLNGIWAFAIYDKSKDLLILSRDPVGVKPLYYYTTKGKLFFASEIKSLLICSDYKKEINFEAIDDFLTLRYIPGPRTIFKNIFELPPGCVLTYKKQSIRLEHYWLWEDKTISLSEEEAALRFKDQLSKSVTRQLISDVPLGAYLSGGIDSSCIVALMQELTTHPVKTFSVGFKQEKDELAQAVMVANYLKTDHREIIITDHHLEELPKIVYYLDQPIGDAIIVALYNLSKLASQEVKVVLTGEGADELLGGYFHQKTLYSGQNLAKTWPLWAKRLAVALVKRAPVRLLDQFFNYPAFLDEASKKKILKFIETLVYPEDIFKRYLSLVSFFTFDSDDKNLLYSPFLKEQTKFNSYFTEELKAHFYQADKNFLEKLLSWEYGFWLINNILFKQDKLAMAHSVEARVPYLDPDLINQVNSFPHKIKKKNLSSKMFLRKAMQDKLPARILRRKKQAFHIPLETGFKSAFDKIIQEYLNESRVKKRSYFNCFYIKNLKEKFNQSPFVYSKQLMCLAILEMWHEAFGL